MGENIRLPGKGRDRSVMWERFVSMSQLDLIESSILTIATCQSRSLGQWEGTLVHGDEKKQLTVVVTAPVCTVTATGRTSAIGKQKASVQKEKQKPHA